MHEPEDWVAATGPRLVSDDPEDYAIPEAVLGNAALSLTAKGLYALLLTGRGQPINPYEGAFEDPEDIRAAIDELIHAGLAVRLPQP